MRVLELFAGIGACSKALERLGIDVEIVDAVEIDKYAIVSFNAIHNTNFEVQDITNWNKDLKDIDLITHGSPCQDFSVAGKQAGGDIGSGTRSSLMYETIRIVGQIRPKYVLWENVKNLLSKKHKHNFDAYIDTMNALGYNSYYQVLNAKDYGIPQNRERVYTISIRKDIDKASFKFPEKEELKLRLKDMLENEVDEKYYLNDTQIERIKTTTYNVGATRIQEKDYCDTLCARDWKDPKCVKVGDLQGGKWDKINESCRRVYSEDGISPTIHTCQGGNTEPKIITHNITQTVNVRKYSVDTEKLVKVLRDAKIETDITNKELSEKLDIPLTQVEHYFRQDKSFAIPSPEIWFELKKILKINTDEFDESIMTFEEKEGVFEKANRIYDEDGLSPTLTQEQEKILIKNETKKEDDKVAEGIKVIGNYMPSGHDASRIVDSDGLAPTVKENHGTITATNVNFRIRKLTPKECWRLMGFDDEDFEKAELIPTSNTQLYKQAGNSIVVNVLEKIFKNLF